MEQTPRLTGYLKRIRAILLMFLLTVIGLSACRPVEPVAFEIINIGVVPLEQNILLYIAEQQGMFASNGLKIVMKEYGSGMETTQAMLHGDVDMAISSEYPFLQAVIQKERISLLATIDRVENIYILGRKDRGIQNIADLRGKRIGVIRKTISEFHLGRFLAINRIDSREVVLVDLKPDQIAQSFSTGEVDAIIAWQPNVYQSQKEVKDAAIWPAQSNQESYIILACRGDAWLEGHTGAVTKFMKSLAQAEAFLVLHPKQAREIVKKKLGYDNVYLSEIWPKHQFALSLDHSLIVALTDEARWIIDTHLTEETRPPDFLDFIYLDGLKTVKPESVEIIR